MFKLRLESLEQTQVLGQSLASTFCGGEVVYLDGDLGVGKTALIKAVGQSMGIDARLINSPTFTYFNLYEGDLGVFHADIYRLEHYDSLHNIGFWDYCENPNYVSFIEWANKFDELSQINCLKVSMQFGENANERIVSLESVGQEYEKIKEKVKNALSDHGLEIL